ncbi:hypothetical protein DYH09_11485 [bacterium CPR1]|nr:hypothetical protein [bacterium CPR1]
MQITQASVRHARPQGASTPPPPAAPEPKDRFVVDTGGGLAAGFMGLVMAGGANSFTGLGYSPAVAYGMDGFIGAGIGMQMAESLGKSKMAGAAIGAGVGLAAAAAGAQFGWPGALATAATFAVLRGVVLPTMLNR